MSCHLGARVYTSTLFVEWLAKSVNVSQVCALGSFELSIPLPSQNSTMELSKPDWLGRSQMFAMKAGRDGNVNQTCSTGLESAGNVSRTSVLLGKVVRLVGNNNI
jgi:hypothetical protein